MDISAAGAPQRLDMSRVVQRTIGALRRNFPVLLMLGVLLAAVPGALFGFTQYSLMKTATDAQAGGGAASLNLELLSGQAIFLMVSGLAMLIGAFTLQAAAVHATVADLNGRHATLGECLSTGIKYFFPLLGLTLLMVIALVFGFILLVFPAIMMAMAWIVAIPAVVVERTGVLAAFGRSAALTRGSRWRILGLVVVYSIGTSIVQMTLMGLTGAFNLANMGRPSLMTAVVVTPLLQLLNVVGVVGTASIYYELRSVKEGIVPETLASVFD